MANTDNNKTILIYTASGTTPVLALTGAYDLRADPFTVAGISGVHQGGGSWNFSGLNDLTQYKLYNTGTGLPLNSLNGGETTVFFDGSLQNYIRHNGTIAFTANQAMGGFKLTGLGAATTNGDAIRFEQGVRIDGSTQTIAKQILFDTTGNVIPAVLAPTTTGLPVEDGHLASKYFVVTLFAGVTGVVQSTYLIKLLPTRSTNDTYSKTTAELCNAYLSGLSNISTYTGVMLIEALGQAANTINLDDGASQWISAGVFIVGIGNKPILNRRAYNSSLSVAGGIKNCRIKDGAAGTPVVSARSYTNFTFTDCEFDVPDATDITFTTCKFLGINKLKSAAGNDITLSNCTGDVFWYNDGVSATVTITGTQPADVKSVIDANFNW